LDGEAGSGKSEPIFPSVLRRDLNMNDESRNEFEMEAARSPDRGLLRDLVGFLSETKKWWLVPVLVVTLLLGLLILLSGTPAGPLIYTLF
jgi:Family of unknown function (DUF5989)